MQLNIRIVCVCVQPYLYGDGYESLVWVFIQQTERSSDVLWFPSDYVGRNTIHDGIVYQVDVTRLERA